MARTEIIRLLCTQQGETERKAERKCLYPRNLSQHDAGRSVGPCKHTDVALYSVPVCPRAENEGN
jgi:hypothetical protein